MLFQYLILQNIDHLEAVLSLQTVCLELFKGIIKNQNNIIQNCTK